MTPTPQFSLGPTSPPSGPRSPLSRHSRDGSVSSLSTTPCRADRIPIPEHWRDETQQCIDNGVLDDECRSDITRTLVTLLTAQYGARPGKDRCQELARQLILTYPFMKDDMGSGYVSPIYRSFLSLYFDMQASWVFKMQECIDNRLKQSRRKLKKQLGGASPNPKRKCVLYPKDELLSRLC